MKRLFFIMLLLASYGAMGQHVFASPIQETYSLYSQHYYGKGIRSEITARRYIRDGNIDRDTTLFDKDGKIVYSSLENRGRGKILKEYFDSITAENVYLSKRGSSIEVETRSRYDSASHTLYSSYTRYENGRTCIEYQKVHWNPESHVDTTFTRFSTIYDDPEKEGSSSDWKIRYIHDSSDMAKPIHYWYSGEHVGSMSYQSQIGDTTIWTVISYGGRDVRTVVFFEVDSTYPGWEIRRHYNADSVLTESYIAEYGKYGWIKSETFYKETPIEWISKKGDSEPEPLPTVWTYKYRFDRKYNMKMQKAYRNGELVTVEKRKLKYW